MERRLALDRQEAHLVARSRNRLKELAVGFDIDSASLILDLVFKLRQPISPHLLPLLRLIVIQFQVRVGQ